MPTATLLTSGSAGSGASQTTASVSPGTGLLLLAVAAHPAGGPKRATATGGGLTWVEVTYNSFDGASSGETLTVLRAMGSYTPGAITIDFAGASQLECRWQLTEWSDVDTGGTNGSVAVAQVVNGKAASGTAALATLAAFGSGSNSTYGAVASGPAGNPLTAGSGFTDLGQVGSTGLRLMSMWQSGNDTTVDATLTASSRWGVVAVEIRAAAAGGASILRQMLQLHG